MPQDVFLALGSNLGDRQAQLEQAERALQEGGFTVVERSALYETEPVGGPPQGPYLNRVLLGTTSHGPLALLALCQEVEQAAGRVRTVKDGPRTLDVDVLFYGDRQVDIHVLRVPHPRAHERRFVLVPLAEIAADFRHPVLDKTIQELLDACPDTSAVEPIA